MDHDDREDEVPTTDDLPIHPMSRDDDDDDGPDGDPLLLRKKTPVKQPRPKRSSMKRKPKGKG